VPLDDSQGSGAPRAGADRRAFRLKTREKTALTHRRFTTVALLIMAITSVTRPGSSAEWQPPQEPEMWQQIRQTLQREGMIAESAWIFFGSLENDTTLAAEYLSNPRATDNGTAFDGLLLLKRSETKEGTPPGWTARPLSMRAICSEGRLERQGADGAWSDYSGRPDTAAKVSWICQQDR